MADAGRLKFIVEVDDRGSAVIKNFGRTTNKIISDTTTGSKKMGGAFSGLWKQIAGAGIAIAALRKLQRVVSDLVGSAIKFESEFANVTTLLDTVGMQSAGVMKEGLLNMAGALGSTEELAKGLYQTLSAGVQPGVEALNVLEKSARFAKAGLVDMASSVDVLTTVINAYGFQAEETGRISDVLFQTIKDGKITGQELASSLGTVIPTANTLGISLEQVTAAIAVMTKGGIKSERAVTSLNATMMAFLKPTSEAIKLAKQYGIEFSKAGIEGAGGFQKWLEMVKRKLGDNEKAMTALFPNVRALKAVFTLTGSAAKSYAEELKRMSNVTGNVDEAFKKQISTFKGVTDAIKNQLSASIQRLLLPALQGLAIAFKELAPIISRSFETIGNVLKIFGSVIGATIGAAIGWVKNLWKVLDVIFPALTALIRGVVKGLRSIIALINNDLGKAYKQVEGMQKRQSSLLDQQTEKYRSMRNALKLTSTQMRTFSNDFKKISDPAMRYNKIMQAIRDGKYGTKLAIDFKKWNKELRVTAGVLPKVTKTTKALRKEFEYLKLPEMSVNANKYALAISSLSVEFDNLPPVVSNTKKEIKDLGEDTKDTTKDFAKMGSVMSSMAQVMGGKAGVVLSGLGSILTNLKDPMAMVTAGFTVIISLLGSITDYTKLSEKAFKDFGSEITVTSSLVDKFATELKDKLGDALFELSIFDMESEFENVKEAIFETFQLENLEEFKDKFGRLSAEIKRSMKEAFSNPDADLKTLEAMTDFLERELQSAVGKFNTYMKAGIQTEDQFNASVGVTLALFKDMINQGITASEAIFLLDDTFETLEKAMADMGLAGNEAFAGLMSFRKLIKDNKALVDSLSALNDALTAVGNTGTLTGENFDDWTNLALKGFDDLINAGFTTDQALLQMAPMLMNLRDLAKEMGIELTGDLKSLIDMGEEKGMFDGLQDPLDRIVDILEAIAVALGATIPGAIDSSIGATEKWKRVMDGVGDVVPGVPGLPEPGSYPSIRGFASGTSGFTVPPGYYNDDFAIGLSSGEHFSVETPTQRQQGGSGQLGSVSLNISNTMMIEKGMDEREVADMVNTVFDENVEGFASRIERRLNG